MVAVWEQLSDDIITELWSSEREAAWSLNAGKVRCRLG